jgi:signal transduction histidine kinase
MRLADFIATHTEPILAEWVAFAATAGPAAEGMDLAALRNHAAAMLADIVADLRRPQTGAEQVAKSRGRTVPEPAGAVRSATAAEVHGAGRAASGFTLGAMISEYRALRASVLRLWTLDTGALTGAQVDDLMRFNEAIDQALAESVARYAHDLERSRDLFLAILSHDLRTPLAAVLTSSQVLLATSDLGEPDQALATGIVRSARRMTHMVGDLLDLTHGWLGAGIPIVRHAMDLATVVRQGVDEMAAAHPDRVLHCTTEGDLRGVWDAARLAQLLANLLGNAVQYGAPHAPVRVTVEGEPTAVVLRVHNHGPAIPASAIPGLFRPLKRLEPGEAASSTTSPASANLGLGLYISERIAAAHDGTLTVTSSADAGTAFTVRLPR